MHIYFSKYFEFDGRIIAGTERNLAALTERALAMRYSVARLRAAEMVRRPDSRQAALLGWQRTGEVCADMK
mgnify:CR=1 FL=1